jgi:radical SAM protein with 4Fe4S-binding SPASM domain
VSLLQRITERSQALGVPLEVLFEITHRCNLPCTHCYLPDHADHGELTFDEICGVLDQLAEAGTVFLTLTGGEVFSRADALEIVDAAAARGFVVKLLTNATMVTDAIAERLAQAGVLEVSVSVYGTTAEVHDRVTEMPGSFHRTMAGIERLRAHGIRVALKAPLLAANGQVARDVRALTQMQNMPCTLDLSIAPKTNGDAGPLALMLNKAQMVRLMSEPGLSEMLIPDDGSGPGPEPCNAGRSYCAIGPTGDVVPCIMMPEVVGNLRAQRFADVWRGSAFLARLRALTAESLTTCRSCDVKGSCSRCPGVATTRGQGIEGCDLSAREVARARVAARHRLRVVAS